jgi:predicted ester cyclase
MSTEENKAIARRVWELVINYRNLDVIDEVYAVDFVRHEPNRDIRGREEAKQSAYTLFEAFPDIDITVEDVIGEGDKVATRYPTRHPPRRDRGVWPPYGQVDGA